MKEIIVYPKNVIKHKENIVSHTMLKQKAQRCHHQEIHAKSALKKVYLITILKS